MVHLEDRHLKLVKKILQKYDYSFYAFGSRVKGTHKPLSDLDLTCMDIMKPGVQSNIDEDFEASNLPFKVDLINYQTLSDTFKQVIQEDLEIFQVSSNHLPHPDAAYPILSAIDGQAYKACCFLKNIIKNKQYIHVGDYTYYHDVLGDVHNFEKNVLYHYDFIGDALIIGKFCQIASGVTFVMNGAQHAMTGISTYPFKTFSGNIFDGKHSPNTLMWDIPFEVQTKGNTKIGNDVWIGYNATIMPGIKIGDGAIIGANATVSKDVEPYTIVAGNPAKIIRKRFDDKTIDKLVALKWWDMDIDKINQHIQDIGLSCTTSRLLHQVQESAY